MYSRKSNDNGANWLPDDTLSDVVSPLPAQPDPGIVAVYAGDYDYGSASYYQAPLLHGRTGAWPSAANPSRMPSPIGIWWVLP